MRLVSGIFLLVVLLLSKGTQGACCGVDVDDDEFGNDHYWFLAIPDNTVIECHKQFLAYNDYALPSIHGWAWELNGCHLTPGQTSAACSTGTNFSPVAATDWCDEDDGDVTPDDDDEGNGTNDIITFSDADSSGAIVGRCGDEERITRTWTSSTSCPGAGQLSDTQIVLIDDSTPPYLCIPNNIVLECTASSTTTYAQNFIFGYGATFDMCTDATLTRAVGNFAPSGACQFSATITYTSSDAGAAGACFTPSQSHTVTIRDTRPPFVTSRRDFHASCADVATLTTAATQPTVADGCGLFPAAPTVTFTSQRTIPGECEGNFVIERQYTVADSCGNSDIIYVNVVFVDVDPPTLTPNTPNEVFYYNCESDINFLTITAADTCSTPTLVEERFYSESHEERLGTIVTQVFTATDACGNSVQRQYDHVVIHDVTATLVVGGATSGTKGATFAVTFTVTQTTVANCNHLTLVVDAAGATLQAGSNACFTQEANGNIYCENPTNGAALTLNLLVPTDYIPDIIRVSGVITSPFLTSASVATATRVVSFI